MRTQQSLPCCLWMPRDRWDLAVPPLKAMPSQYQYLAIAPNTKLSPEPTCSCGFLENSMLT